MKKIICFLFALCNLSWASACDICGCGVGSYYIGLLPEFNKRFIGIRYQHSSMTNQLNIQGQRTALSTDETYQSTEIWGAWNIANRFRLMAIAPYSINKKYNAGTDSQRKQEGMGDIVVNGYYQIFQRNRVTKGDKLMVQSLWGGIGVKLATGKYSMQEQTLSAASGPNIFQLGTGSTDILVNVMYDLRIQDMGINSNVSYKINTENKDHYQYGNKATANMTAYYKFSLGQDKRIAPNIGIAYDHQQKDVTMGYRVEETGGRILNASVGAESTINRLSMGMSLQKPLSQDLAQGRTLAKNKIMAHISFAF